MPKTKQRSVATPMVASSAAALGPWWDRTAGHYLFKAEVTSRNGDAYTVNLYRTTDNALLASGKPVNLNDSTNDRYFTDLPTTIHLTDDINTFGYLAMSALGGAPETSGEKWPPAFRRVSLGAVAQALRRIAPETGARVRDPEGAVRDLAKLLEAGADDAALAQWRPT